MRNRRALRNEMFLSKRKLDGAECERFAADGADRNLLFQQASTMSRTALFVRQLPSPVPSSVPAVSVGTNVPAALGAHGSVRGLALRRRHRRPCQSA
jgi:hypothetical protein